MIKNLQKFIEKCHLNPPATNQDLDPIKKYAAGILPDSYLSLLLLTNGLEGQVANGSYVVIWKAAEVIELNQAYRVEASVPGMLLIGSDGGDEAIGIDLRQGSLSYGQYFRVPFVPLAWKDAIQMGVEIEDIKIVA